MLVLACVVLLSATVQAGSSAPCCPSCDAWQGDCPIAGISIKTFDSESACVASVPGGCLYNPQGTWTGIYEPCAPSPCSFFSEAASTSTFSAFSASSGGRKRLGTCVPGVAYDAAPIRTSGIYGAYAALVNQSQTVAAAVRQAYDGNQLIVGPSRTPTSDILVSSDDTLFWTQVPQTERRLRSRNTASGYTEYTFDIDNRNSGVNYGASEEYIITGTTNNWADGVDWRVYAFGKPEALVSKFSIKQAGSSMISHWPIMRGHNAFVLDVDTTHPTGPNQQDTIVLHTWDVRPGMNSTHRVLNVNISHCLYPEQAASKLNPDTILSDNYDVLCRDDNDVATCTLYYAGTAGEGSAAVLCQMDMNGTTTPLIDASHSNYVLASSNPLFSPSGVVYAAASGTKQVTPGDTMVYLYASSSSSSSSAGAAKAASYHWFDDMLNYDVTYCFAPAFPNLHLPSSPRSNTYVALVGRKLIYRVSPGFGTAAFFGFDFDTNEVAPINLPWGTPNTRCNVFTYGGSCDRCTAEVLQGYTDVYAMSNGSLVFKFAQNDDAAMFYGVAQLESSFVLDRHPAFGCMRTGCSAAGGFCDHGRCHCFPGCAGQDCSQGSAFCSKTSLDWCSSDLLQQRTHAVKIQ
jgi:hypothetical protein